MDGVGIFNTGVLLVCTSLFVEAIVEAIKGALNRDPKLGFATWEIIAMVIGIVVSVFVTQTNLVDLFKETTGIAWYIGSACTGIIFGRGSSFFYDLYKKIRTSIENNGEEKPE